MPHDHDTGCEYHTSCFTCPFVMCLFDYPGGPASYFAHKALQDLMDSGMSKLEAAEKLGIKLRGAQRRYAKTPPALRIG